MKSKTEVTFIMPVFNEEHKLANAIESILNQNYQFWFLILVNDASNDNTIEIINNLKKKYNIILLNNNFNKGQSYSICNGINESKNNTIVTLDGDGQNNPADIISLLDKYFSDDDIYLVGGIRQKRKDNLVKIYSSLFANKVRSYIFDDGCKDTGCSLKVFDREIFLEFPFFDGIHRFLPALFKGYGYKTDFINVSHRTRIRGMSNYGTFDRLYRGIIDIIKVKKILKNNANK